VAIQFEIRTILDGHARIAPPGQEGWREAPGWWFKHYDESSMLRIRVDRSLVRYVGVECKLYSGKRKFVFIAKPFYVVSLPSFRPTTPAPITRWATPPGQAHLSKLAFLGKT
jgi:hypothetical protein